MGTHIKVLIADTDKDFCRLLSDRLTADGADAAYRAADGASALELCERVRPDVLILDLVLPKLDGLAVIERLKDTGSAPAVFVVSALYNDELVARCADMGVRFFTPKPCDVSELAVRIRQSVRPLPERCGRELESEIADILRELGVPAHVKGYHYLRRAIELASDDADILGAMTKELYPAVAGAFSVTPQRVERDMRRAIEIAWRRCSPDARRIGFGAVSSRTGRPSNGEFIAAVADRISIERKLRRGSRLRFR